jgi:hypothetical protein
MTATWNQIWNRWSQATALADDSRTALAGASFLSAWNALSTDGVAFENGARPDETAWTGALASTRAALASACTAVGGELGACLSELGLAIGKPDLSGAAILPQLYDAMANNQANTQSPPLIQSRQFTRGAPTYSTVSGGSVVGNGTLYRLTVDRYGFPIESDTDAEPLVFTCRTDAQSGSNPGQETFDVKGAPAGDPFNWWSSGFGAGLSGPDGTLRGVTGDDTQNLVANPSFSAFTGTGASASFSLSGWTLSSGSPSSMSVDNANYYRACSIEGTSPGSLSVTGSVTLTQTISTNGKSLDQVSAYLSQLAINRSITPGTGTVTVQIGSKSWSLVLAAQTGWQLLLPSLDKNLWFQNFNTAGLAVTITITITSGTLKVDDFVWQPFTNVGWKLFWLVGGSTNFRYQDTLSISDSEVGAKNQRWVSRIFPGWCFPSAALPAAPAAKDTVATGAGGAGPDAGIQRWASTFVTASYESPPGPLSDPYVADGAHAVTVTVPTGPGGTVKRGVYRTHKNDPSLSNPSLYFVGYINDNVTATYTDSSLDAAITKYPGSVADAA